MTPQQRAEVTKVLLGDRDPIVSDRLWAEFQRIVSDDVHRIEPVIDQMLRDAKEDGRQHARKISREVFQIFRKGKEVTR